MLDLSSVEFKNKYFTFDTIMTRSREIDHSFNKNNTVHTPYNIIINSNSYILPLWSLREKRFATSKPLQDRFSVHSSGSRRYIFPLQLRNLTNGNPRAFNSNL